MPKREAPQPRQETFDQDHETPESKEQRLSRELVAQARLMINAYEGDFDYIKKYIQREGKKSGMHFYTLDEVLSHVITLREVPFKFEKSPDRGGWLGCDAIPGKLLMVPADRTFFQYRDVGPILAEAFEFSATEVKPLPIFKNISRAAVFTKCPEGYRVLQRGEIEISKRGDQPNLEYTREAHSKAELYRAAEEAERKQRLAPIYEAERRSQKNLIDQARRIKQLYEDFLARLKAEEQNLKNDPYTNLAQAIQLEFDSLSENQRAYLTSKLEHRVPTSDALSERARAAAVYDKARRMQKNISFLKGFTQDGKAVKQYLAKVAEMTDQKSMDSVNAQYRKLEKDREIFKSERRQHLTDQQAHIENAGKFFTSAVQPYLNKDYDQLGEKPRRLEEWDRDGLWAWLEKCAKTTPV